MEDSHVLLFLTGCWRMKTLEYFTKPELVKLLLLLEKEGIQVEVAFDNNFARLYRKYFRHQPSVAQGKLF